MGWISAQTNLVREHFHISLPFLVFSPPFRALNDAPFSTGGEDAEAPEDAGGEGHCTVALPLPFFFKTSPCLAFLLQAAINYAEKSGDGERTGHEFSLPSSA